MRWRCANCGLIAEGYADTQDGCEQCGMDEWYDATNERGA